MAIDPSIPLSNYSGGNLIQSLGQITQLKGIQQQQQANVAASQAYKEATGPDGSIDYGRLTALLSQGPAAYNLPQIQAQVNEARNSQLTFDTKKLELAAKKSEFGANGFGSLLASGRPVTQADVMRVAAQGIKQGLFDPTEAVSFTSDMPSDPSQLTDWVKQKYLGFGDNIDKLKAVMPQTQTVNSGGTTQFVKIDPLTGNPTLAGNIQNTMAPGEAAQPTQVYDPATQSMRNVTREQFSQMAGGAPMAGAPGMADPSGQAGLGTGRLQPITQAPGVQAAPALGSAEAAQVVGKGAAESSISLQRQADAAPQAIYQLQNMREALSDINTGPNADWRAKAQALALGIAPDIAQKLGIDPQKIASQEEFNKFAVQLAQGTAQSLGEGTDSKLASAVSANPNISLSKLGNQQIIDVLIASQRATQAKNMAWQNSGLPPEQYNKFSTSWGKEIDPRVFAAQDMSNDKVWKMVDSLPKREQENFMKSWAKAQQLGYVQ